MRRIFRSLTVLLVIAAYSSVIQASGTSVFDDAEKDLSDLVIGRPSLEAGSSAGMALAVPGDSIEVQEIEIPEEKEGNIYKEVAMITVIAAFVGYIIVTYFFSSDDEEEDGGGGKDIPTSVVLPVY